MRYFEIIKEALDQYWDHIFKRFLELEKMIFDDPEAVMRSS